ncbi:hypothetical protein [Phenylobacterium sp.]|uniref:hypothetical protein n=1 Tax=Phenylobacterium sp. TaxID=1871053 RepID=UPI003BACC2CD
MTWDLNGEKPNYATARARFVGRLDQFENIKDPGLDSVRFVSTNWTANQISDDLRTYLDDNDKIVVTKLVSGNHQGWLAKNVWDWINARL